MPAPKLDVEFWENLWAKTLREHPEKVARRAPSARLVDTVAPLTPGHALDAGCGHGAEALWLALAGWRVTAVDFSASALAHGRAMAAALGPGFASNIEWIRGDLSTWEVPPREFDLVVSLYVHAPSGVDDLVRRLAQGVARGGTLLLVGHRPVDPATGAATAAAGQCQVSVEQAVGALDPTRWAIESTEERRPVVGSGVDAVIRARRLD